MNKAEVDKAFYDLAEIVGKSMAMLRIANKKATAKRLSDKFEDLSEAIYANMESPEHLEPTTDGQAGN